MIVDPELMRLECRLRLIEHIDANPPPTDPLGLWVDGFWSAIEAMSVPRTQSELEQLIEMRQAVHARQQESRHANYRSRPDSATPARRKSDAAADELSAYLSEAHGPERDRDGPGRPTSHDDAPEVTP